MRDGGEWGGDRAGAGGGGAGARKLQAGRLVPRRRPPSTGFLPRRPWLSRRAVTPRCYPRTPVEAEPGRGGGAAFPEPRRGSRGSGGAGGWRPVRRRPGRLRERGRGRRPGLGHPRRVTARLYLAERLPGPRPPAAFPRVSCRRLHTRSRGWPGRNTLCSSIAKAARWILLKSCRNRIGCLKLHNFK